MTRNKKNNSANIPFVSVCTPTFNRRPFVEMMIKCFDSQDYPKDKMEWVIIDDGTDPIEDLVKSHPSVKYFKYENKMTLGKKRNIMNDKSKGEIIVYMDDDDFYPPDRVSHAVERLLSNPTAMCAGSSELYIYFNEISKMVQFGPYGAAHATAGTFAFKRKLLKETKYNEDDCLAEEREFLKNYTVPFIQLDPMKTILVFSHSHNTTNKRLLLDNMNMNSFIKYSSKRVGDFIKDASISRFFIEELEDKLIRYEPGNISMKPDVLKQLVEFEKKRKEMETIIQTHNQAHNKVQNQAQKQIAQFDNLKELYGKSVRENMRLKEIIDEQQKILDDKNVLIGELETKLVVNSDIILVNMGIEA